MTKSTVDIIVVTFNRIKYLKTFIRFVHLSTYYPFNLIVVDNGSTDGSREFILDMEKVGMVGKHVFTSENYPLARAFSEGLKETEGEFVVTVADDMVTPVNVDYDWLEIFVAKMNQDKDIGCINFVGARCSHDRFLEKYGR